jgi:hypothetical protein
VGFAVLGGFVFKLFAPYNFFFYFVMAVLVIGILIYLYLLKRQIQCLKKCDRKKFICD